MSETSAIILLILCCAAVVIIPMIVRKLLNKADDAITNAYRRKKFEKRNAEAEAKNESLADRFKNS